MKKKMMLRVLILIMLLTGILLIIWFRSLKEDSFLNFDQTFEVSHITFSYSNGTILRDYDVTSEREKIESILSWFSDFPKDCAVDNPNGLGSNGVIRVYGCEGEGASITINGNYVTVIAMDGQGGLLEDENGVVMDGRTSYFSDEEPSVVVNRVRALFDLTPLETESGR